MDYWEKTQLLLMTNTPSANGYCSHGVTKLILTKLLRTLESSRKRMHRPGILFSALAAVALIVTGLQTDWRRLPIQGPRMSLNDQAGYVSVARHWVDEGRLDSSVIYPSLLLQTAHRNSLYMPGCYAELALCYRLFGYSALTSRLPALVSFLLACVLVYWIARRLYGEDVALYAGVLFACFPLNLIYAFAAMAETPLVAAGLLALAAFLFVRSDKRWWVGSIALVLPVVFRETGIVLGLIMGVMLLFGGARDRVRQAVLSGLLAFCVFFLLLVSSVGAGRPSMWKANILARGSNEALYSDAFALVGMPHSAQDWIASIGTKTHVNVGALLLGWGTADGWREGSAMLFLLSGIPLGLWLWVQNRDPFALGVALALAVLLAAVLSLYIVWYYRGVRSLLLVQPLVAILWGLVLNNRVRGRKRVIRAVPVVVLFLLGVLATRTVLIRQGQAETQAKENTAFLESVVAGDGRLLVSPYALSLDYVNEHYPQLWAFPPSNCATTELLNSQLGIGIFIMSIETSRSIEKKLCNTNLEFDNERIWRGVRYWVYRNRSLGLEHVPGKKGGD